MNDSLEPAVEREDAREDGAAGLETRPRGFVIECDAGAAAAAVANAVLLLLLLEVMALVPSATVPDR